MKLQVKNTATGQSAEFSAQDLVKTAKSLKVEGAVATKVQGTLKRNGFLGNSGVINCIDGIRVAGSSPEVRRSWRPVTASNFTLTEQATSTKTGERK